MVMVVLAAACACVRACVRAFVRILSCRCIYCIPCNAQHVLKINVRTEEVGACAGWSRNTYTAAP